MIMRIFYEIIFVGEVITNQSLTVDRALELIGFDEQKFCEMHNFDSVDYSLFELDYETK